MKFKHWFLLASFVLGIALPAVLGIWSHLTPDVVIEAADAGRFVSASTSAGGLFAATTTTVQSTRGSFAVYGHLSTARGQPLRIVRRLKGRVWLCVETATPVCQPFAGVWAGPLKPIPHPKYRLAPLYRVVSPSDIGTWLFLGCMWTLLMFLVVATSGTDRQIEDQG